MKRFLAFILCAVSAFGAEEALMVPTTLTPATGDLLIWSGSQWIALNRGTNGQVLTATASSITWSNAASGGGGGSGTVTSVGASTTVSGLGFSGSPVTTSGTLSLTGTVAVASGGTGATDASGARTALSLVPGTDVQAYDTDLAAIAALANSGIIVRTGSGTVAARTITGDSEAVVSNGDGVSGNPTLSIGSAIARDAEVAAGYQPLDADLTAMAAGTAVATAQTNAVSFGAPVLYVGTTNVAAALASGGGGGTWDGTPIASGTITNLTTSSIQIGGFTKTNGLSAAFSDYEPISVEFINGASVTTTGGLPWFSGTAVSSGTSAVVTDETNRLGIVSISSASGANSGWYYMTLNNIMFAQVGMTWESATKVQNTNAGARTSIGFHDVFNLNNPTDAIRVFRSNDTLYGQVLNNTTLTQTSGSAIVSSNQWLDVKIQIVDTNQVAFNVWDGDTGSSLLSETLTAALPSTSARVFGMGIITGYTNAAASLMEYVDKMKFSVNKPTIR